MSMSIVRESELRPVLLTLPETAQRLRRSKRTIMRMNTDGQIKLVQIRKAWLCPIAEVERIEQVGTGSERD